MKLIDLKGKLKVGQMVKEVRTDNFSDCFHLSGGKIAEITQIETETIYFNDCMHPWDADIELDIELAINWDNFKVGDTLFNESGMKCKILEIFPSGKTFLRSFWSDSSNWENRAADMLHIEEAQFLGFRLVQPEDQTVEILGKKYKKEEVEKRLNELEEVE